jgi:hypothetical protein
MPPRCAATAIGGRCPNAVAYLDAVTADRDPAIRRDFDGSQRTVPAGAVVLGGTCDADTDEKSRLLSACLLVGTLLPDRMRLQLVQDLGGADRHAVSVSRHGPAAGLERIAPPEFDRVERQCRGYLVDQYLERGRRLQRPKAAHRSCSYAARVERIRRHIDFRNIVDAERGDGADGCHIGRKIGEASAIQRVVSGESDHLAGGPIDAYPRADFERVPFDSGLKLLEAIVREPHRTIREEHRRQRDVKRERRVVASAECAAA